MIKVDIICIGKLANKHIQHLGKDYETRMKKNYETK
jgi:23S rRNA pseudoU1915 N3-methylase RlmH